MAKRNRRLLALAICSVALAGTLGLSLIMGGMVSAGVFMVAVGIIGAVCSIAGSWNSTRGERGNSSSAVGAVDQVTAVRPKWRFGCLRCFVGCGAVLLVVFVLLGTFVYWNVFRNPPFRISEEIDNEGGKNEKLKNCGGGIYVKYVKDSTRYPGCYPGAAVHGCRVADRRLQSGNCHG